MESKNLNDIVIEDADNNKKAQLKNILTLLALLFIILVISIVITKLILGSDDENNATNSLSSETTTQISGNSVATTAAIATGVAATTAIATSRTTDNTAKNIDDKKENTTTPIADRNKTSSKKIPLRDHRVKKEITHTAPKVVKHKVIHKNEYKPVKKKKVVHKIPAKKETTKTTRGYYIKVGAFKDPSNAIKKVKANHLKYKTMDTENGMATRVLVGPYYSQTAAQKDIAKVRANIAKDAYITKMP